ncbi:bacillithiol biosynthesis cysteine-adding enzyme BshC [Nonlabens tegetincola]|nr:bacillithiol biosynthesis cysteine-adding enzyme BshC [Nonlabens tegetincola]
MDDCHISYQDLRYFSNLMKDYLDEKPDVKSLYHRFPNIKNFENQIEEKSIEWSSKSLERQNLVNVLRNQYNGLEDVDKVLYNIDLLEKENTFTITTGHQLNLFTGPLYFFYKIIDTINLTNKLRSFYPKYNFVPIYWMASEDHDFEEIQYFNYAGKKIVYETDQTGAVGRFENRELDKVYKVLELSLGKSDYAQELLQTFEKAYLKNSSLSEATRVLVHNFFKNDGLLILDADDTTLKKAMVPFFKQEFTDQKSYNQVNNTLASWPDKYKVQVNPRENNLFYLKDNLRSRIISHENNTYSIDGTDLKFDKKEILEVLNKYPERFSPNVILRPLYQEVILPNLCYIGGGGEMAYWLQLKQMFDSYNVTFPMLLLRNSVLIATEKQLRKLTALKLSVQEMFLHPDELKEKVTNLHSEIEIDFSNQKSHLKKQFQDLYEIATKTDHSFYGAVAAQERKQIKGLENLEKRLLTAQKRKLKDVNERALKLQEQLFPNGNLQERVLNFSSFYEKYGSQWLEKLKSNLNPFDLRFTVIKLPD